MLPTLCSIRAAKKALLEKRDNASCAPGLDDKQLTSWNALAIRGLAIAGRVLERDDLVEAAVSASRDHSRDNLMSSMIDCSRATRMAQARFPAYLDDYAFLIDAMLELLQTRAGVCGTPRNSQYELADLLARSFRRQGQRRFLFHGQ